VRRGIFPAAFVRSPTAPTVSIWVATAYFTHNNDVKLFLHTVAHSNDVKLFQNCRNVISNFPSPVKHTGTQSCLFIFLPGYG